MARITTFTYEQVTLLIQKELRKSYKLNYVANDAIVILPLGEDMTIPEFKDYLIRISAPETGFIEKRPKIGRYYRNYYFAAIECYLKSGSRLTDRLLSGNISANKGIWEFFQDVSDTLEHNTFDNELDPLPGTSIETPSVISTPDQQVEGVGFIWVGNQDNIK